MATAAYPSDDDDSSDDDVGYDLVAAEDEHFYHVIDGVEDYRKYCGGGLHPVAIGDSFNGGRYKIVHKLGYGAVSTVWLARDQGVAVGAGRLVSLKILTAKASRRPIAEIAELNVSDELARFSETVNHPGAVGCRVVWDHFMHEGPNGSHLCLVSDIAGPSLASIGEWERSRRGTITRLRADVGRKIAKQLALAVDFMHSAGIVHGDITSSNILFRVSDEAQFWDDVEIYARLGSPQITRVKTSQGLLVVVSAVESSCFAQPAVLREDILIVDYGMSFVASRKPAGHRPGTQIKYLAPELYFDSSVSFASDVWSLACVIFEVRAGYPPFDGWFDEVIATFEEMVMTLGKFPEPWWSAWCRSLEDAYSLRMAKRATDPAEAISLRRRLHDIEAKYREPKGELKLKVLEEPGTLLDDAEVELLDDLLGKMLRYRPEERISMKEVVQHPWFQYEPAETV